MRSFHNSGKHDFVAEDLAVEDSVDYSLIRLG